MSSFFVSFCVKLGSLSQRSVHPAAPVLLTKNGPLGTNAFQTCFLSRKDMSLTNSEFEKRQKSLRLPWKEKL